MTTQLEAFLLSPGMVISASSFIPMEPEKKQTNLQWQHLLVTASCDVPVMELVPHKS